MNREQRRSRRRPKGPWFVAADWLTGSDAARRLQACPCPAIAYERADGELIVEHWHQHTCRELRKLKAARR